jgi:hypothetical protein
LPKTFAGLMAAQGLALWTEAEVAQRLGCILGLVRLGSPRPIPSPWRVTEIGKETHPIEEVLELSKPMPARPMCGLWALPAAARDALVAAILQQAVAEALRCAPTKACLRKRIHLGISWANCARFEQ